MSDFMDQNFGMSQDEANSFNGQNQNNSSNYQQNNNQGGGNNYQQQPQQQNNQGSGQGNYQKQGNYQNNRPNNQGGGYNNNRGGGNSGGGFNRGGGGGGFKGKPRDNTPQPPFLPVLVHIEDYFPDDVKQELIGIIDRFINSGFHVRYNADEKAIFDQVNNLSATKTEAVVPWNGFNDIQAKNWFNTPTALTIAEENNPAWDKLPKIVQTKLGRNVRSIFGRNNDSPVMAVITWSGDGARKRHEVTRDTGYVGSVIRLADRYHFPVYNIGNGESKQQLFNGLLGGNN